MYESVLKEVLYAYGLQYRKIYGCQKGYRNEIWPIELPDGQMINITFFKREVGSVGRIRRTDAVSEYLDIRGMPTRRRIDPRILQLKNSTGVTNVSVYTYLSGQTLPWEGYTMTHLKLLGKAMSDMHALLVDMPTHGFPSVYDEYHKIIEHMRRYFMEPLVQKAIQQKLGVEVRSASLDDYDEVLRQCRALSSQQVLHMDFVRGNILFEAAAAHHTQQLNGLALSGILDFEKTTMGNSIVDVARTLAFLLVDCKYKSANKVTKYFLYSGYQKRGNHSITSDSSIRYNLIEFFLLYDFYKFLRHNPYESLQANQHYVRTRDILLKCNVLYYG